MEMHQVRYFLAAAEELNFTRAAERSNVAQPTMTRAIKQLEYELGGELFHRDRNRTHLTDLGRMMVPYMRQIWQQACEAKRRALEIGKPDRTALRLGLMCTIAPQSLVSLVRSIRANHADIDLQVTDATALALVDQLAVGEIEAALLATPDSLPDKLHGIPLYSEPFVIAVGAGHPLAGLETVRAADLDGLDYLDRINCELGEAAARAFEQRGVRDRTVYKSDRDDWILAMAAAGLGYAFMPQQSAVHAGVVAKPLIDPEFRRDICLVTLRGRPYSMPLGALIREATRIFRRQGEAGRQPDDAAADATAAVRDAAD
jgi:DNA-binding transcriptional LysR family regulator